jgi:hypothetical protein
MIRRLHQGAALIWAFALGLGPAPAQPVVDEYVYGAQVFAKKNCALLVVKFHVRMRYASHFPLDKGDELRIQLQPIDRPTGLARLTRREGVRVDNAKLAGIRAVTLDLDRSFNPVLRIQFDRSVAFTAPQINSFETLAIGISQKGSPSSCRTLEGGNSGGATQIVPDRKPANDKSRESGQGSGKSGSEISRADLKVVEASMDEARAAMHAGKFEESIRRFKKILKFPENKHSKRLVI